MGSWRGSSGIMDVVCAVVFKGEGRGGERFVGGRVAGGSSLVNATLPALLCFQRESLSK